MTTLFATIALVLGLARLVMFIALHRVESDYNVVEHAVSDYAVGRTRALSSVMTWTTALSCLMALSYHWYVRPGLLAEGRRDMSVMGTWAM